MNGRPENPPPPHNGTLTSVAAAASMVNRSESLREEVYRALAARGEEGATDEELQAITGQNANTQRPRRIELVRAGRIEQAGDRRRRTRSGRMAAVWIVRK